MPLLPQGSGQPVSDWKALHRATAAASAAWMVPALTWAVIRARATEVSSATTAALEPGSRISRA